MAGVLLAPKGEAVVFVLELGVAAQVGGGPVAVADAGPTHVQDEARCRAVAVQVDVGAVAGEDGVVGGRRGSGEDGVQALAQGLGQEPAGVRLLQAGPELIGRVGPAAKGIEAPGQAGAALLSSLSKGCGQAVQLAGEALEVQGHRLLTCPSSTGGHEPFIWWIAPLALQAICLCRRSYGA